MYQPFGYVGQAAKSVQGGFIGNAGGTAGNLPNYTSFYLGPQKGQATPPMPAQINTNRFGGGAGNMGGMHTANSVMGQFEDPMTIKRVF